MVPKSAIIRIFFFCLGLVVLPLIPIFIRVVMMMARWGLDGRASIDASLIIMMILTTEVDVAAHWVGLMIFGLIETVFDFEEGLDELMYPVDERED